MGMNRCCRPQLPGGAYHYRTFHHISEAHLHRYLAEFDFRYNNRSGLGVEDNERSEKAISGAAGKRLFYQEPRPASHA